MLSGRSGTSDGSRNELAIFRVATAKLMREYCRGVEIGLNRAHPFGSAGGPRHLDGQGGVIRDGLAREAILARDWRRALPKPSAGLLMFRRCDGAPEVLLVHPGGPFWTKRDLGAWSIPKGEFAPDEDPLAAARREFAEETGIAPAGQFIPLSPRR